MIYVNASRVAAKMEARRGTVLVVEDSDVIRRVVSLLLEGEGYAVVSTNEAAKAVDLARQKRPLAITLDLELAEGNGRTLLRCLKDDPATQSIPVVILTASSAPLDPADRWHAADVIPKPFDVDDLLDRLDRAIQLA